MPDEKINIGGFISKEVKYGEALLIGDAAKALSSNEPAFTALLDSQAPAGVDAAIAVIERADSGLGPVFSATINTTLNTYKPEIEAGLETAIASGTAYVPALVAELEKVAAKLQAEAAAA